MHVKYEIGVTLGTTGAIIYEHKVSGCVLVGCIRGHCMHVRYETGVTLGTSGPLCT